MFPRARLKRFNEASENVPGVGSYNIADRNASDAEKNLRVKKLNQSTAHLRDKAFIANVRGELPKHVEDLHQRLKASEERIIDLDILKISADKERDILQRDISDLKELLQRSTDEVSSLKAQQCAKMTSLSEELQQEKKRFNSMISEMYGKTLAIEELKTLKHSLDEELSFFKGENKRITEAIQRLRNEISAHKSQHIQDVQNSSNEQRVKVDQDEMSAWIDEISSTFLELLQKKGSTEEELSSILSSFNSQQSECKRLKEELESAQFELSNVSERHKQELEKFAESGRLKDKQLEEIKFQSENKLSQVQTNLDTVHHENQDLRHKIGSAHSELNNVREQYKVQMEQSIESLRLRDEQLEDMKSQTEEKLCALQTNLNLANSENEKLREKIESTLSELRECKEKHEVEVVKLTECVMLKDRQLHDITSQTEESLSTLRNSLDTLKKENEELRGKADSAYSELSDVREQHREEMEKLVESNRVKDQQLEEVYSQTEVKVSALQANLDTVCKENGELQDKLNCANSKLSETKDYHKEELEKLAESVRLKEEQLEEKNSQTENKLSALLANLETAHKDKEELKGQIESAHLDLNDVRKQHKEELEKLLQSVTLKDKQLEEINLQAEDKLSFFQTSVYAAHKENEKLKNRIESKNLELSVLQQQHREEMDRLEEDVRLKLSQFEEVSAQKIDLEDEFSSLEEENEKMRGEIESLAAKLTAQQEQHVERVRALKEEKDYQEGQYTAMLNEMSEKIQQLEDAANLSHESHDGEESWKERYEDLERRMEPFREVIEAYEVEKKLIQDRDKYTQEQIEKLQQEAIKNMGHQNHKQKVKYVNSLKQENVALHQKYQESQEELFRQTALVRKYKQRLDMLEGSKSTSYKADVRPRTVIKVPLKEGNR